MFEAVDLYCERLGPGFWAEPVNALTNASFLVGAWFTYLRARQLNDTAVPVQLLIALMCAIGIGSGLFHTVANGLTRILDVVPILLFQLLYLWLYCRDVIAMRAITATGLVLAFFVAALIGRQYSALLNGAPIYMPAVGVLLLLGAYHLGTGRPERFVVIAAAMVFGLSLGSRTLDAWVCPMLPLGTHFLWHLLNGAVLYLLMRGYLASRTSLQTGLR